MVGFFFLPFLSLPLLDPLDDDPLDELEELELDLFFFFAATLVFLSLLDELLPDEELFLGLSFFLPPPFSLFDFLLDDRPLSFCLSPLF